MINAEGVMMKQFRLRLDLSKFFHDARQFCWIFVDGTKIQHIIHIQQHISKLFSITEPFHLLLNDAEYLPPTEDVRILKENETIQVIPGLGIRNQVDNADTCNGSIQDKQVHMTQETEVVDTSDTLDVSKSTLSNKRSTSNNTTQNMTFYSVIDDTVMDDTKEDSDSKIPSMDNNLTEDCSMTDSVTSVASEKRKRVRKRKPKNRSKTEVILSSNVNEENNPKKPKILDTYIIPSGKHIRFDNTEKEENNIAKQIVQEVSKNESSASKMMSSSEPFASLFELGQSSTPITFNKKINKTPFRFINKKAGLTVKMENDSSNEIRSKTSSKIVEENISTGKDLCDKENIQSSENRLHKDLEKIPVMTRKPQNKDIIAFKTLKIGADFTPQISNFIMAEVVASVFKIGSPANPIQYKLKILKGKEEVQVPAGKFSLSQDTSATDCDSDTISLSYSQMQETRLLSSL